MALCSKEKLDTKLRAGKRMEAKAQGPRSWGSPVLEPPGVPPPVPAVVVVGTRIALATEAWRLRALLGLVAAQHEVGV